MARILVVDDVKFIASMLASVFEAAGHDVDIATSGPEALRKARRTLPDLILLDLVMPDMDGLEVARRLKSAGATHAIPIMMVSSKGDLGTVSSAFAADVAEFVTKPFETEELVEKASLLLGDFRMTYSVDDEERVPTVTVLHDEIAVGTFDLLLQAMRMAAGNERRPIVLDLSRVRKLDPETEEEIRRFGDQVRDLGEELQVVRPESGTRASAIFPGIAQMLSLHDDRGAAVTAARRQARVEGLISGAMTPTLAGPLPAAATDGIRFEPLDALVVVRISGPRLPPDLRRAVTEGYPKSAHVVLLDLSEVERVRPADVATLAELVDEIVLTGRQVKIVNPAGPVAETLRAAGQGASLFWMKERRRHGRN